MLLPRDTLFQHSREAVISGNTKSGKVDKSSTFEIMDQEEFRELEDTVTFFHNQKHTSIKIEVNTKKERC